MLGSTIRVMLLAITGAATGAAGIAPTEAATAQQTPADATRGPRFLVASAASSSRVAPLDVSRTPVLRQRITLDLDGVALKEALAVIAQKAGLHLAYTGDVVPLQHRVRLRAEGMTVAAALMDVLVDVDVDVVFLPEGRAVLRKRVGAVPLQSGVVLGRVTDAKTAAGIGGVEVILEGTRWRASTDSGGFYHIANVDTGTYTLTARRLGYAKQSRRVQVWEERQDTVDLALEPVAARLDELVTTATGRRRRLEIANDVTTLNADSIVRTQPITSVTDLLEGRVPGLTVQRTSGAPGDPARLRLRGAASPLRSNDPIVVIDGVRIYAEQSSARNTNLAGVGDTTYASGKNAYATPSPLDYLDPNSIETIEVIKGPSAATLYGQDAANGVIMITTKKGKAGPTRWTASAEHGRSRIAGDYPELMLRWGHLLESDAAVACTINNTVADATAPISNVAGNACTGDSVVTFQLLNDPALTVLDRGRHTGVTLGASGGSAALTYAVTGSYYQELGLPRLPGYEAERYQARTGMAPPDWMRRPQRLTRWAVTSGLTARLGPTADLSLRTGLSRTVQQRSSLEQQLGTLMSTYLDRASGTYYSGASQSGFDVATTVLGSYYERVLDRATALTTGLNLDWRPRPWLTVAADAGLNLDQRADEIFLPRGAAPTVTDSTGHFNTGQGTTLLSTVNLRANAQAPLGHGFQFRFGAGMNYNGTAINDLSTQTRELAPGRSTRGAVIEGLTPSELDNATFGWYVAPSLGNQRFNVDLGLRLEGGGIYGSRVKGLNLPKFPKLGFSYLFSDEPFFPFKDLFQSFRVRVAYGRASRQPGPTDRLRLYGPRQPLYQGGQYVPGVFLETLGNTEVRPERSTEFEGGFDTDLWDSRINLIATGYRKTTDDALLNVPLAPSIYGNNRSVLRNIGIVRVTGVELSLNAQWVRSGPIKWGTQLQLTQNRNVVVDLGTGVEPFYTGQGIRIAAGYPLFGRWSKPILGYADRNGDGVLQRSEIQLGDTAVYVGQTLPNYTLGLQTTVALWQGALEVSAGLLHDHGVAQKNEVAYQLAPFSRGWNDPTASLAEQAATTRLGYGPGAGDPGDYNWIQTVSTTRLNNVSVRYRVPALMARRLGARDLHVALQGTNLGLWTNYRGLDPNVNAFSTGNDVTDTGILPEPRSWQVRVTASY